MFSQEEYQTAWFVYIGSSVLVLLCWWWLVSKIPGKEIRHLLRLIPLLILVVPAPTSEEHDFLSPAWFTSIADILMSGTKAFWRAGLPVIVVLAVGILLSFCYFCWRWMRARKSGNEKSDNSSAHSTKKVSKKKKSTKFSKKNIQERKEPVLNKV